ncbi:hypothetical protein BGZ96_006039 [Linnemannia gamsii]|uniref:Uncharacterized protein n=1 Tax=Linnemannia gamsii TaxID=64522 RepID=A0ABQ7KG61_9FUNG|nr:hypothetical protein BGZ96_006039 [Linnemannia gamsii]
MSHQRSQSTSSILNEHSNNPYTNNNNSTPTAPLSISLPRQRSMSTSFGFATAPGSSGAPTSPISTFPSSSINPNPFLNHITSPPSASTASGTGGGSNGNPTATLASLSSSIPSSLNRRFSANFTNPLTTTNANMAASPTSTFHDPADTGGGGGGGIGGLFRKFSVSGRSGGNHQLDRNEPGPASSHDIPNTHQGQGGPTAMAHIKAVDALKAPVNQKDQISRSSSPMRNMILNGQMLD